MKKLNKRNQSPSQSTRRKLTLNRETLRQLHSGELQAVAGGSVWFTCTKETTKVIEAPEA